MAEVLANSDIQDILERYLRYLAPHLVEWCT
jgi:hypothetical protein